MEPEKKISFGFSKLSKKPLLLSKKPLEDKKVELIESFEGNTVKVKNAVEEKINEPLVIPVKENQKNILDRIRNARNGGQNNVKESDEVEDTRPDSELTLDELAARELIKDAKRRLENTTETGKVYVLPLKEEKITEGEPESTLEDYENIPISDYGMAMLRGMGWREGLAIGKNQAKSGKLAEAPELRPKGLGLGASKLVKSEAKSGTAKDKDGNELVLKRGALAKVVAGANKGKYCEVQGLDDEAGRVIVRTTLKGEILTLHEFLVVPVTKEEYARNSKILNTAKYEEYKEKQNMQSSMTGSDTNIKTERDNHEERIKMEPSEEASRSESSKSQKERYRSKSESNSESEDDRNTQRKGRTHTPAEESGSRRRSPEEDRRKRSSRDQSSKHNDRPRRRDDSDQEATSDSEYERKKKHHKKKDKRSRRDRSRSPSKKKSGKKSSKSKKQSSSPDSAYEESYSRSKSKRRRSRSRRRKHSSRRSSS